MTRTAKQRIEQTVKKAIYKGASPHEKRIMLVDCEVVKLILAERARLRRGVRAHKAKAKVRPMGFERLDGYLMACDDILALWEK